MADDFYTQNRDLRSPVEDLTAFGKTASVPYSGGMLKNMFPGLCVQTTYSYRTGKRFDKGNEEDELSDLPTTEAGVLNFLRNDKESIANLHPGDTGHVFESIRTEAVSVGWPKATIKPPSHPQTLYQGPVWPLGQTGGDVWAGRLNDADWYGTHAIAATIPSKPSATLADAVAQIVEHQFFPDADVFKRGLGLISSHFTMREVPQAWLNYEFGWIPFREAVTEFVHAAKHTNDILRQYARDSGRDVRREYYFEPSVTSSRVPFSAQMAGGKPPLLPGGAAAALSDIFGLHAYPGALSTVETRNIWWKGCYTYNLPVSNSVKDKLDQAERLFGVELTPADCWDLAPWSWLADWRAGLGDIITNASYLNNAGTALKYGYVMVQTIRDTTYSIDYNQVVAPSTGVTVGYPGTAFSISFLSERKQRFQSTPYGFGINPSAFSDTQWLILGALGLLKAPRTLW